MKRKTFLRYSISLLALTTLKTSKLFGFYSSGKKLFLNKVRFIWSGAVTTSSIKVHAGLTSATSAARLVVSADATLVNPMYGPYTVANTSNNFVAPLSIAGLTADTPYYYAVEADGIVDTAADAIGKFKTAKGGAQSFKFTVASCNNSGAHPAWLRIKDKNPFLHITHGDFHYGDPNSATDINIHRAPFEAQLAQPAVKEFLQSAPIAYMWDDHDYCGDNTDATAVGRTNARFTFQEYVPHFPLVAGSGDVPIYQAFTVGRVRFILTDLRSEKGSFGTSMMGATQKAWFKNECLTAKNNNHAIIWISSVPWGPTVADAWTGYDAERIELSDFFKTNAIINLMIICGDMHMLGIDNGTNHDFATGGNPFKYPVIQAAAVNQVGSYRGGTFSEGYFLNPSAQYGQYMLIEVTDNGGSSISYSITGYRVDSTGAETVMLTYTHSAPVINILPLLLLNFTVSKKTSQKQAAILTWQIEDSGNCKQFVIERSADGIMFQQIKQLSCTGAQHYSFTDEKPIGGKNFYRIKLESAAGSYFYSAVKQIDFGKPLSIKLKENPVQQQLYITIDSPVTALSEYMVIDATGKLVLQSKAMLLKGANDITVQLPATRSGVYSFIVKHNGGQATEKFLVK